jgi:hypothetical protein
MHFSAYLDSKIGYCNGFMRVLATHWALQAHELAPGATAAFAPGAFCGNSSEPYLNLTEH